MPTKRSTVSTRFFSVLLSLSLLTVHFPLANAAADLSMAPEGLREENIKEWATDLALDMLAAQLKRHSESEAFVKFFAHKLSEEGRLSAEILLLANGPQTALEVIREGNNAIVIRDSVSQLRFEVVDADLMQYRINGLLVVIDPKNNLEEQIETLQKKSELRDRREVSVRSWILNLFVPEAAAILPGLALRAAASAVASEAVVEGAKAGAKKVLGTGALTAARNAIKSGAIALTDKTKALWKDHIRGAAVGAAFGEFFIAAKNGGCAIGNSFGLTYEKGGNCASYIAAHPEAEKKSGGSRSSVAKTASQPEAKSKPSKKPNGKMEVIALKCEMKANPPTAEMIVSRPGADEPVSRVVMIDRKSKQAATVETAVGDEKELNSSEFAKLKTLNSVAAKTCIERDAKKSGTSSSAPQKGSI